MGNSTQSNWNPLAVVLMGVVLAFGMVLPAHGAEDGLIVSDMYANPALPGPTVISDFLDARDLWLKAMKRPEAELKYQAIQTIAVAHAKGMKGLESMIAPLFEEYENQDSPPTVRIIAAKAILGFDSKSTASRLFEGSKGRSLEIRQIIEPNLARWNFTKADPTWIERLADTKASNSDRVLAMRCLALTKPMAVIEVLQKIVSDRENESRLRIEAARTLGAIRVSGAESEIAPLLSDKSRLGIVQRSIAFELIRSHTSAESTKLLKGMLHDPESSIVTAAAENLLARDAKLLVDDLATLLDHREYRVRQVGVEVLRKVALTDRIERLFPRLNDAHPEVRTNARKLLEELAKDPTSKTRIIEGAMKLLSTKEWQGLEQVAILLTRLDHKPAAPRFVELLDHERPEVFLATAWGLRKLAVDETLPGVTRYVAERLPKQKAPLTYPGPHEWYDHQLSQLHQFIGEKKYAPADSALRAYIGRIWNVSGECRASAIWALGLIHEGKPDRSLATALEQRINEGPSFIPPEEERVRRMSAIAIGRMKDKESLPTLRKHFDPNSGGENVTSNGCAWAIEQLTGEKMPEPKVTRKFKSDWFLIPRE